MKGNHANPHTEWGGRYISEHRTLVADVALCYSLSGQHSRKQDQGRHSQQDQGRHSQQDQGPQLASAREVVKARKVRKVRSREDLQAEA